MSITAGFRMDSLRLGALAAASLLLVACGGGSGEPEAVPGDQSRGSTATSSASETAEPTASVQPLTSPTPEPPTPTAAPAIADRTPPPFDPPVIEPETAEGVSVLPPSEGFAQVPPQTERRRYDASAADVGVPALFDVPAGWRLFYGDGLVAASPIDSFESGMAIISRPRGSIASAADVLDAVLLEADGAYELVDVADLIIPEGFEAVGVTRATRDFEIGGQPDRILANWLAAEGVRTYWAVALLGDRVLLGVIESPDPSDWGLIEEIFAGFRIVEPPASSSSVPGALRSSALNEAPGK